MPSSWLAAWLVLAAIARPQSFATRDELALIEALARDGFSDLATARLAALEPRAAAGELLSVRITAARVARCAAGQAATPAGRIGLLRDAIASLVAVLAPAAAPPPRSDAPRAELVALLRDLARALATDAAADPAARAAAGDALHEARRQLEILIEERRRRGDAAPVDLWLPVLDAARLCFDEAGLLPPSDPQRAGRLRSAREQAYQFAWKIGPLSVRSLDARLLAGRAAFELGDFEESAARMLALFDDENGIGTALEVAPELRTAAAQTWFDALASAAATGGARERAALEDALPRLETLGAKGAPFLLAAAEFAAATASPPATAPGAAPGTAPGSANDRIVRFESALLWLRLVGPDDPDRDRALLLTARCTLALAAAGHATFAEALAPLDALASFAATHPAADRARAEVRERLLLEAEFDRGQVEVARGRADAALACWRALARRLLERSPREIAAADRTLLHDVALALGGGLTEQEGRDVATPGAGTRAEAAELWTRLADGPPAAEPALRAAWREAAFYSIWCLAERDAEVARKRLAEFDAAARDAGNAGDADDATWKRRFDELRARWR